MKFGPFVEFYDLNFKEVLHVDIMLKYKAIEEGSYESWWFTQQTA